MFYKNPIKKSDMNYNNFIDVELNQKLQLNCPIDENKRNDVDLEATFNSVEECNDGKRKLAEKKAQLISPASRRGMPLGLYTTNIDQLNAHLNDLKDTQKIFERQKNGYKYEANTYYPNSENNITEISYVNGYPVPKSNNVGTGGRKRKSRKTKKGTGRKSRKGKKETGRKRTGRKERKSRKSKKY